MFFVKQIERVSWHSQVCCFGLKRYKKEPPPCRCKNVWKSFR